MAEGDDQKNSNETNSFTDDPEEPITLDLGIDPAKNYEKIDNDEECAAGASLSISNEAPRREENPFSFKHFLRGDTTYQSQGARPKVYCDGRQIASVSDLELNSTTSSSSLDNKSTRIVSEFNSGLPDFVQDHLVIEQSYLAQATASVSTNTTDHQPNPSNLLPTVHHPIIAGLGGGNLPDFTRDSSRRLDAVNTLSQIDTTPPQGMARPQPEFPLDLPLPPVQVVGQSAVKQEADVVDPHNHMGTGNFLTHNTLLLPDFLTDASRLSYLTTTHPLDSNTSNSPAVSPIASHQRNGHHHSSPPTLDLAGGSSSEDSVGLVEAYRRQIAEQAKRITDLNGELGIARQREQDWSVEKGKLQDDVEMSSIRAASAESTIIQLNEEIKTLSQQLALLLRENSTLPREGASCNNPSATETSACVEAQVQHFAQELRGAASNAERNLRQLLSGVDNLRLMASYMETSFGVEERPYLSNRYEKDNERAD